MTTIRLDAALAYARRGWAMVPLIEGTKKPHIKTGRDHAEAATCDLDQVSAWWTRWPDSGIGVVCKSAGFLVIDVDDREEFLALPGPFPLTCASVGREGRFSLWYRVPPGVALPRSRDITEHVELKAAGSLVVAPPSLHPSGRRYAWDVGPSFMHEGAFPVDPAMPAPWMLDAPECESAVIVSAVVDLKGAEATAEGARRLRGMLRLLEESSAGDRHKRLYWSARQARALHDAGHLTAEAARGRLEAAGRCAWAEEMADAQKACTTAGEITAAIADGWAKGGAS